MALLGTTIVAVRRDGVCAIAGDGQVTMGERTLSLIHISEPTRP